MRISDAARHEINEFIDALEKCGIQVNAGRDGGAQDADYPLLVAIALAHQISREAIKAHGDSIKDVLFADKTEHIKTRAATETFLAQLPGRVLEAHGKWMGRVEGELKTANAARLSEIETQIKQYIVAAQDSSSTILAAQAADKIAEQHLKPLDKLLSALDNQITNIHRMFAYILLGTIIAASGVVLLLITKIV
jgi:hypothetical protein